MDATETTKKYNSLLYLINNFYVDTMDMPEITEKAIILTLKELDPHSSYIPKSDVEKANEPLEGSFGRSWHYISIVQRHNTRSFTHPWWPIR